MNRLRVRSYLLRDVNRVVYAITGEVNSRNFSNVNNVKNHFFRNDIESSLIVLSTNSASDKLPTKIVSEKKIVSSRVNKIRVFGESRNSRNNGFITQSNLLLATSNHRATNISCSVRCFSDLAIPDDTLPNLRLTGIWKSLSESVPVEFAQDSLVWIHSTTGLPWWATIILTTWTIRATVTLPLALYQNYIIAKVENLKYEMDDIVKDLKRETNFAVDALKWTEPYARAMYNRSLKKQWQKLLERDNCHPAKGGVLVIVQIPIWITLSAAIRNMCYMLPYPNDSAYATYLELSTGGFGWITNLAAVDHTFIIPITLGLLNLTIIEIQCMMRDTEPTKIQRYLTNFLRLVSVGMIPLASMVPSGLSLYWASSSAFGILQNFILMSPRVRELARIPPTEKDIDEPYRHLYNNFRKRLNFKEIVLSKKPEKS